MGEADTMEVKQRLAKSLNVVIECAGPRVRSCAVPMEYRDTLPLCYQITPHAQMISKSIPQLCKSTIDASLVTPSFNLP